MEVARGSTKKKKFHVRFCGSTISVPWWLALAVSSEYPCFLLEGPNTKINHQSTKLYSDEDRVN